MNKIPTFNEMYKLVPDDIRKYLDRCADTPQSPDWHPEGDVLVHIKIVYNRARKSGDINQALAAIFHDLGKADTTKKNKAGRWAAHGHENVSARLVEKHKKWIGSMGARWFCVYNIVKEHMRIKQFDNMRPHKQEKLRENKWFEKFKEFTAFDNMMTLTDEELSNV